MVPFSNFSVSSWRDGYLTGWRRVIGLLCLALFAPLGQSDGNPTPPEPALHFAARKEADALAWQRAARERLVELMMGGHRPDPVPLRPLVLRTVELTNGGGRLEELTLQTLADRTVHVWVAAPRTNRAAVGAVLALHGHGGNGEEVVRGEGLYWYGRTLAEMGYVVIAPDIGQHSLQHTNWSLMGERVWDALRCVDYLLTRPDVDPSRIGVVGLSLGGETAMYVAALDERIRLTGSSGWLTTVANLKNGHCPCWNFPGLEEQFDLADIFACIAPRPLVCELGEQERAPGGFPVELGRTAFARIRQAYRVFKAESNALLTVHSGGHVLKATDLWPMVRRELGVAPPWLAEPELDRAELLRRGEIARRCFGRALGALEAGWKTRDPATGLFPQRLAQPIWAPVPNAAEMLPSLALTSFHLARLRLESVVGLIPIERELTTRWRGLPDAITLASRAFVAPEVDPPRLVKNAVEYCWRGLLPMTEAMDRGPWSDRMRELIEAVMAQAAVRSDSGNLPADDAATNGALLQVLSRLYWLTHDQRYLDWALRIGDAYALEVLPRNQFVPAPRWDFVAHRPLADASAGTEGTSALVAGLAELFLAAQDAAPRKARQYEPVLTAMAKRWLPSESPTGRRSDAAAAAPWSARANSLTTLSAALRDGSGRSLMLPAMRWLAEPSSREWSDAQTMAGSLAGVLSWLSRVPEPAGVQWVERILPRFLAAASEASAGEDSRAGAEGRAALMAGLYFTQGFRAEPWTPRLRYGAAKQGETLLLAVESDEPWNGRLVPDRPRHRVFMNLPMNYPRSGEWPEWFAVTDDVLYSVTVEGQAAELRTGARLRDGLFVELKAHSPLRLELKEARH